MRDPAQEPWEAVGKVMAESTGLCAAPTEHLNSSKHAAKVEPLRLVPAGGFHTGFQPIRMVWWYDKARCPKEH